MDNLETQNTLLEFFKALADANRLKMIGFLAQRSYTVGELSETLGLSLSTTSNHLSTLARIGLVSARTKGHYSFYSLEVATLQEMSRKLLQPETLPRLTQVEDTTAYDRKVIDSFLTPEGRLVSLPAQEKKFQVILRFILKSFEPGVHYTEKQTNEILARFHEDVASLRRGMIEYHLMERAGGGGEYWRPQAEKV